VGGEIPHQNERDRTTFDAETRIGVSMKFARSPATSTAQMGARFSTLVTSDHTVWSILNSTLPYTARDSYEAYFEKTDTHRQAELVRLLLLLGP
jgi:hypothetical protein